MNLIKSLKERKGITFFFIIAFTIGILIFSIGNSAIVSQKNLAKEYNSKNNKSIGFDNYKEIKISEVMEVLKTQKVNSLFVRVDGKNLVGIETVFLRSDEDTLNKDMKTGDELKGKELEGNDEIAVFSTRLEDDLKISSWDETRQVDLKKIGSYYEIQRRAIIPNGLFEELYGAAYIQGPDIQVILRGEPGDIRVAVKVIEEKFSNRKIGEEGLTLNNIAPSRKQSQGQSLLNAGILIFIITIINSISISALWVKSRKKEIVLRKVLGAKNMDIAKIFFGELFFISVISMATALIIQYSLTLITTGFIGNIDLRLNLEVCIRAFVIAIITAVAVSIPAFKDISKIQPAEMLREE